MATLSKVSPPSTAARDESLKRNTDCVYFLASPLTCKKGNECEFRHSESARTNPRDCYYWLNGNCLNPKCAFRHPPLDGLVPPQTQAGNFAGPPGPPPPAPPSGLPVPAKQAVPCIFFQQGYCLKGDLCPFLHGPIPLPNTKIRQNPAATPATEPPTFKKTFGAPEKYTQTKMGFNLTASKVVEAPRHPQPNTAPKVATARLIEETPKYKETAPSRVDNGGLRSTSSRPHHTTTANRQNHQNRRDVDDSIRESSPGFDVLVDYKLKKDEYHHDEDKYMRMRDREGRTDEFSMGHQVDFDSYRSKQGYNPYSSSQDEYARVSRGTSSERQTANDRRGPYKLESQNSSDLRYRLSKQRRSNGLPSVVSPDNYPLAREYHSSQRDTRTPMHDRSVGSRLQGRIKFPGRSPPLSGSDMISTRDNEPRRNLSRSSPSTLQVSSHQGRLRDRLSGRGQDESSEGRTFRGPIRKDSSIQDNWAEFSGPKGSPEVRSANGPDLARSLVTEGDISFDGPKPLSEILKRKRSTGMSASMNIVNSVNKESTEKQVALSSVSEQTRGDIQENNMPVFAEGDEEEGEISNKKVKLIEDDSSIPNDEKHLEEEEGLFGGDEEQHEVDEEFDQEDVEYDYEQDDDVEGYNLNEEEVYEGDEGDNDDLMDEDDGDDFAKKLGVSF